LSYAALDFLVALFYALSALLQPLAGFVADPYGARSVLLGGIAFFVAGIAVQAFAGLDVGSFVTGCSTAECSTTACRRVCSIPCSPSPRLRFSPCCSFPGAGPLRYAADVFYALAGNR